MMIELKGVQFVNKGAELMLWAILDELASAHPSAEFCMQPRQTSPYHKRAKIGAFQKLNLVKGSFDFNRISYLLPQKLRAYLKRAWGIVTEADIDVVFDASGFRYGDQWSNHDLKMAAKESKRLKAKGKHYIFLPQALGPFTQPESIQHAKVAFENARLVVAREEQSLSFVQSVSSSENVISSPDFTNLITPEASDEHKELSGMIAIIPNSKMISAQNANDYWRNHYVQVLVEMIDDLQSRQKQVFLLNHEGKSDARLCQEINSKLAKPLLVVSPDNALEVKAIIGQASFIICSRFHGCVSALSQGVPCVATSWSHKYEALFSEYEQSDCILEEGMGDSGRRAFLTAFIDALPERHNVLMKNAQIQKERSTAMWQKVKSCIS